MIYNKPLQLKKITIRFLIIILCIISAYIIFIGIISIWVGLNHLHQDGFWMPLFVGAISIIVILWLFLRFLKFILNILKEKDLINV